MPEMSWKDAIRAVLTEARQPMHYTDIGAKISEMRLKTAGNPAASVNATISAWRNEHLSPILSLRGGYYALRESIDKASTTDKLDEEDTVSESGTGSITAFGMFWLRDQVVWSGEKTLFGWQGEGSLRVDFAEQAGVYLLHDRDRVIYVGRADKTLFARLKVHTIDRLNGRWDRFSWFGLRAVNEDGSLQDAPIAWTHSIVIQTLEALLIESLEPPLNKKGGDNFSGAEYLQVSSPHIEKNRIRQAFENWLRTQ